MKKTIGLLAVLLATSVFAVAEQGEGHQGGDQRGQRDHRDFGGGYVPKHGPPPMRGESHPQDNRARQSFPPDYHPPSNRSDDSGRRDNHVFADRSPACSGWMSPITL